MKDNDNELPPKRYLGDSVYAEVNGGGQIILTTNNGGRDSNTIYLEPAVFVSLIEYYKQHVIKILQ